MKKSNSDDEFIKSLFHAYDPSKYDPVKAHAYYERTKKLKGRRKGKKPVPVSKRQRSYYPTQQPKQKVSQSPTSVDASTRAQEYQARLQQLRDAIAKKNAANKAASEKKALDKKLLETKKLDLESKKLDLETKQLELDSQKTDLDIRRKALEAKRSDKKYSADMIAQEENQINLDVKKLDIQQKKLGIEKQKIDAEEKELTSPKSIPSPTDNLVGR